jgi:DNA-binding SARP family transcriptional activator
MDAGQAPRVALLDGFALEVREAGSVTVLDDLPRGAQRLIAHLGLCGRPGRGAIAGHLWPDAPEDHAQGSLRSALWRVQKVAPGLVDVSGGALGLAAGVHVDVREFTDWARRVMDPRAGVDAGPTPDVALRRELLPGWYDDWVLLERERLRQLRMHALEALADKLVAAGRCGEALQAAYAAVRTEPLRESAHRAVVRVHLAEGNTAEAVRAYTAFRDLLAAGPGVEPTALMTQLIARARPSPRARDVPLPSG